MFAFRRPRERGKEEFSRKEMRHARRKAEQLESIGPLPKPKFPRRGSVVISVLTGDTIRARGKVEPHEFFPGFCRRLAERGYGTEFAMTTEELVAKTRRGNYCVIHLYNEERVVPEDDSVAAANASAQLIMNGLSSGRIIGNKKETNEFLSRHGILVPPLATAEDAKVFTNAPASTSRAAWITDAKSLDAERYNTRFIDTRVAHQGKEYFTTVRLLTVGPKIVQAFVGARNASAGKVSVHGVNTPRDADLSNALYQSLFLDRQTELRALARKLDGCLGSGFYHHDLLIERETGQIYVAEVGYKFDAYAFGTHMESVINHVPYLAGLYGDDFAYRSADALIQLWSEAA